MTSRMAPTATFKAFRPNLEGNFYATDEQNVTVNLEDRTLVSESLVTSTVMMNFSCLFRSYWSSIGRKWAIARLWSAWKYLPSPNPPFAFGGVRWKIVKLDSKAARKRKNPFPILLSLQGWLRSWSLWAKHGFSNAAEPGQYLLANLMCAKLIRKCR